MWESIETFFGTYGPTIAVFILASVCAGCLVEIFKQSLFAKMEEKYKDNPEKLAKIKTIKAGCAFALAAVLVGFFLGCIWKSSLPKLGNAALLPIYYTAMYLLQMLCDLKGVKNIIARILGNLVEPKKKKKKVTSWVEVEE